MSILNVRKLSTSEDEGLQEELTRLDQADVLARDLVVAGAVPDHAEPWARVHESIDLLANDERHDGFNYEREEWAYYLGIAVGLRIAQPRGEFRR